jgi:hypothetical protein
MSVEDATQRAKAGPLCGEQVDEVDRGRRCWGLEARERPPRRSRPYWGPYANVRRVSPSEARPSPYGSNGHPRLEVTKFPRKPIVASLRRVFDAPSLAPKSGAAAVAAVAPKMVANGRPRSPRGQDSAGAH